MACDLPEQPVSSTDYLQIWAQLKRQQGPTPGQNRSELATTAVFVSNPTELNICDNYSKTAHRQVSHFPLFSLPSPLVFIKYQHIFGLFFFFFLKEIQPLTPDEWHDPKQLQSVTLNQVTKDNKHRWFAGFLPCLHPVRHRFSEKPDVSRWRSLTLKR